MDRIIVFANGLFFCLVYLKENTKKDTISKNVKIVPELNGRPIELTMKISVFPNRASAYGNRNLNTKNKNCEFSVMKI